MATKKKSNLMGMMKAQDGLNIDPALLELLGGKPQVPPMSTTGEFGDAVSQEAQNTVYNKTAVGAASTPAPGANALPEVPGAGTMGILDSAKSLVGDVGQSGGEFSKDAQGLTEQMNSGDIAKDSVGKALKTGKNVSLATGNPLIGAAAGLAAGTFGYVAGKVEQGSRMRRAQREEEQMGSDFQRKQTQSSVYADPNSVYYAAKDGAAISKNMKGKGLMSMMCQEGGGTSVNPELIPPVIDAQQETVNGEAIQIPKKFQGKNYHYEPGKFDQETGTLGEERFYKTGKDVLKNVFRPNQPAQVTYAFQEGGGVNPLNPLEVGAAVAPAVKKAYDYVSTSIRDMMTVPVHNPYKATKTTVTKGGSKMTNPAANIKLAKAPVK